MECGWGARNVVEQQEIWLRGKKIGWGTRKVGEG